MCDQVIHQLSELLLRATAKTTRCVTISWLFVLLKAFFVSYRCLHHIKTRYYCYRPQENGQLANLGTLKQER